MGAMTDTRSMALRGLDIVFSLCLICVLFPVFVIVGISVKLSSSGPIVFRASRIGRGGVAFTLFKFRSMRMLPDESKGLTVGGDSRITQVGKFLRRTKLDELPQLVNVLVGSMSMVGPRPEDPRYVELYAKDFAEILTVRPGITGAGSLQFRHEEKDLAQLISAGLSLESAYETVLLEKIATERAWLSLPPISRYFKVLFQTVHFLGFKKSHVTP